MTIPPNHQTANTVPGNSVRRTQAQRTITSRADRAAPSENDVRISADDRAWFHAHPDRHFRLRSLQLSELPAGAAWVRGCQILVVRRQGYRLRFAIGPEFSGSPNTEDMCAELWRVCRKCNPDIDSALEAFAEVTSEDPTLPSSEKEKCGSAR